MRISLGRVVSMLTLATALSSVPAAANTFTVFGPAPYVRSTGAPQALAVPFTVLNPATDFVLRVDGDGVASATIAVNGDEVLSESRFNGHPDRIEAPIRLAAFNVLSIELRGAPGGVLTVTVIGTDDQGPEIMAAVSEFPNAAGWNNRDVTVSFSCADAISGVQECPSPITVSDEGRDRIVSGTAVDRAGNSSTASVSLSIDKTAPVVSIGSPGHGATLFRPDVQVLWAASDAVSGISSALCGANEAQTSGTGGYECAWTLSAGLNQLTVAAVDAAGNVSTTPLAATLVTQTSDHVGALNATPPVVEAATASVVTLTARVTNDGSVDPAEVFAVRELPSSELIPLTRLVDDGSSGDAIAGDQIFTGRMTLSDATPVVAMLRVRVSSLPDLTTEFSTALAVPIIVRTTAEQSRARLADQLRAGNLEAAYRLLGNRLAVTNALERIEASSRLGLIEALGSCSVVQAESYFQVCAGEAADGTPFRFFMVPDQSGTWRVVSW